MRARWGVFDSAMRQVAIFDYNQRAAPEEKAAELAGKLPPCGHATFATAANPA
jgi:hypothetical protein